jgi:hypothetical protein
MPRFSLRTLIVVMLLGGPVLAVALGFMPQRKVGHWIDENGRRIVGFEAAAYDRKEYGYLTNFNSYGMLGREIPYDYESWSSIAVGSGPYRVVSYHWELDKLWLAILFGFAAFVILSVRHSWSRFSVKASKREMYLRTAARCDTPSEKAP